MYVAVSFDNEQITPTEVEITPTTFKALNLKEHHLEEFIRLNIGLLFEDDESLLIVGQQVRNASRGISDLTAIDSDGNIVLIEIKRDLDDIVHRTEPFEIQAIRYAASYATIKTPENVVDLIYGAYIDQHRGEYDLEKLTTTERARRDLTQFLESNDALKTFNQRQRIILIASAFDEQTLSAVAWLIANGIDISCIAVTPAKIGEMNFLEIIRVLPPVSLNDFYVELAMVDGQLPVGVQHKGKTTKTYLPRMDKLFEWGLVKAGDKLAIKNQMDSTAEAVDAKQVRYNGRLMSYNDWGTAVTGWSVVNVYESTIHTGTEKTLHKMRLEKMAEIEKEKEAVEENDA